MKKLTRFAVAALASGIMMTAQAHPVNQGYVTDSNDNIIRTGAGRCLKTGFWKASDPVEGCAGYVKPAAPVAAAPTMTTENKQFVVNFAFDSAVVNSVTTVVNYISGLAKLNNVTVSGYTDQIGTNEYNMILSEKRAKAVADALQKAGVAGDKITTEHYGESKLVKNCDGLKAGLKECLAPSRRVEVNISGDVEVK